ncbi:hypothetical protein ABEB36_014955 [Hypothenemus hampei]|uniref:acid phosphatase n=1 Tax=Hypothenemus hampei TaxID=57062 RepID=A0ABD1E1P4_HYPHA
MKIYYCFIIVLQIFSSVRSEKNVANNTLVLAHVIFRHGDGTPSQSALYKSNKFYNESFYDPYGYGQLTNKGKLKEYNLGVTLRKRYATFLNSSWNVKVCEAWSTDYDRTKMSLSLVLGGLFPAEDPLLWNPEVPWQPIPYNYLPVAQDKELSSWACPTTLPLIYSDAANMEKLKSYDGLINTLRDNTGEDVDYISALDLFLGMYIQKEMGFPLDNWTSTIFPEPFKSYFVDFYYIETSTKELKTVLAGYILKKIITNSLNKINGSLVPPERKIFLYSGHEVNAATVITSLNLYNLVDFPTYASYLIFEVHNIDGIYGIMIYYEDNTSDTPHALTLPGCKTFCPLEDFIKLTQDIIPTSDVECYGNQTKVDKNTPTG